MRSPPRVQSNADGGKFSLAVILLRPFGALVYLAACECHDSPRKICFLLGFLLLIQTAGWVGG